MSEPCVFIIDDDESVREAICFLLETVGLSVRPFSSATEFLQQYHVEMTGCIISDIRMPGMSGLAMHQELIDRDSTLPVIFITGHGDIPMAVEAVKNGATDFHTKPFRDQDLLDSINVAMEQNSRLVSEQRKQTSLSKRLSAITVRERQVFDLLIAGKANKVIAQDLNLSPRTVEVHRSNMMGKMKVRTITELIKLV